MLAAAAVVSVVAQRWWPVASLAVLLGAKAPSLLAGPSLHEEAQFRAIEHGAVLALLYIGTIVVAGLAPLPQWGVTVALAPEVQRIHGMLDEPWRGMAWGVAYFALLGLYETLRPLFGEEESGEAPPSGTRY
jgi:hypothetical protein